jgi:hypothetical protein
MTAKTMVEVGSEGSQGYQECHDSCSKPAGLRAKMSRKLNFKYQSDMEKYVTGRNIRYKIVGNGDKLPMK